MAGSVLNPVRRATIAVIAADDLFTAANASVTFQFPVKNRQRVCVWTNNGRRTYSSAALRSGRNFRTEEGRFDICLAVEGVGMTVEDTTARADTYLARIEELISDRKNGDHADWSTCAGLTWIAIEGEGAQAEFYNEAGHFSELTIPIHFSARLT